jgi:hypothetical protein
MSRTQTLTTPLPDRAAEIERNDTRQTIPAAPDWAALRLPQLPSRFVSVTQESALPERLQPFAARLDANEFQIREAAMLEIAADPSLQADLERVVFSDIAQTLPPELQFRLNAALRLQWENNPTVGQLREITASCRKGIDLEPFFAPSAEIAEGILTGNREQYDTAVERLQELSGIAEAYIASRDRVQEQYRDVEPFVGVCKPRQGLCENILSRLEGILSDPNSARPEMFGEIEQLHDLVLGNHGVTPQSMTQLESQEYYAIVNEITTIWNANAVRGYVESVEQSQEKTPYRLLGACEGYREAIIEPFEEALASGDATAIIETADRLASFGDIIATHKGEYSKAELKSMLQNAAEQYQVLSEQGVVAYDEFVFSQRESQQAIGTLRELKPVDFGVRKPKAE